MPNTKIVMENTVSKFTCSLLLATFLVTSGVSQVSESISVASITALQKELADTKVSRKSSSTRRRAYKGVIRDAEKLIKSEPNAPNRFELLALILSAQRNLLEIEKTQRNRDDFYETCKALVKAPDEYSSLRLNAELLLSDRELSAKDADATEREKALLDMVKRYRYTSAELKSLIAAIRIAPQLAAYDLKNELIETMTQRFAGDPEAIAFSRTFLGASRLDVLFAGTFERLDGKAMVFPQDRLGHPYFVIFWSKTSDRALDKLKQLKEQQDQYPDLLEFYSLNLDELDDAGKSIIDEVGLKCVPLKFPGGIGSEVYKTYALYHPSALRVNQYGHAIVPPTTEAHKKNQAEEGEGNPDKIRHSSGFDDFAFPLTHGYKLGLDDCDRYISQIRSIFIGDILVHYDSGLPEAGTKKPTSATIEAVRKCFVKAPMRYRLSKAQEYANYKKANDLCARAIAMPSESPDAVRLRNYRIIALIGMANLSGNYTYLSEAVSLSQAAVKQLKEEVAVIPRFCLAIDSLRSGKTVKSVLDEFISHCGGKNADTIAHSAACILAMHGDSRDLYERHRAVVLEAKVIPPGIDAFVSFLRDRYHQLYVFRGSTGFYLYDRVSLRFPEQNHMINNTLTPMVDPLPPFTVTTLDGKTLSLPDTQTDQLTVIVFIEAAKGAAELPGQLYSPPGEPTKRRPNPQPGGELGGAIAVERTHVNKAVKVITVFLNDDIKQAEAIRDKYGLSGTLAILPGGVNNPIVNRLGILSADRFANMLLIRRDGTIAWRKHGLIYQMVGKRRYYWSINALRHNVTTCNVEAGYRALKEKDYKRAQKMFAEALGKTVEGNHKWNSTLAHGRALAHLALKDYEAALAEIESAIQKHLHKNQFNHDSDMPCTSMIHMQTTKAKILEHLGRTTEARAARNKAAVTPKDYPTHYGRVRGYNRPYEVFENKMSDVAKEIE